MSFEIKHGVGTEEVYDDVLQDAVSVDKGQCLYWNAGYAKNDYGTVKTNNLLGVSDEAIDNSGGSAGDTNISVQINPLVRYSVGTGDTMTQAYCGYNCALASNTTITSASEGTDITGVFKVLKMISASKVEGRFVFSGTSDT